MIHVIVIQAYATCVILLYMVMVHFHYGNRSMHAWFFETTWLYKIAGCLLLATAPLVFIALLLYGVGSAIITWLIISINRSTE